MWVMGRPRGPDWHRTPKPPSSVKILVPMPSWGKSLASAPGMKWADECCFWKIKKSRGRRGGLEGNTLLWLWLISPVLLVLSVQTASNTSSTWEPIRSVTCMLGPQVLLHQRLRNLCFNKLPGWFWMLLKIGRIVQDPVLTSSEGLLCFGVSSTVKSRFHHWK